MCLDQTENYTSFANNIVKFHYVLSQLWLS